VGDCLIHSPASLSHAKLSSLEIDRLIADDTDGLKFTNCYDTGIVPDSTLEKAMANSNSASSNKISLSADIVAAYVTHNSVPPGGLPALIESVHSALTNLGAVEAVPKAEVLEPAVPIRKSITPSFLICLDDGRKLKTLKRHLANLGMTPDQYRTKWSLPKDYPMVAPDYAATRSALAKKLGLGQLRKDSSTRKSGRKPKGAEKSGS
jgi:predicted transcriptional regulator